MLNANNITKLYDKLVILDNRDEILSYLLICTKLSTRVILSLICVVDR